MSLQIRQDNFHNLRAHLRRKPRSGEIFFDNREIYEFKRESMLKRRDFIANSPEAKAFFQWIFSIQIALNLTPRQFMNRLNALGGSVSLQTLRIWRKNRGHYPCEKNYKALLILERETQIIDVEIRNVIRETTTELLLK